VVPVLSNVLSQVGRSDPTLGGQSVSGFIGNVVGQPFNERTARDFFNLGPQGGFSELAEATPVTGIEAVAAQREREQADIDRIIGPFVDNIIGLRPGNPALGISATDVNQRQFNTQFNPFAIPGIPGVQGPTRVPRGPTAQGTPARTTSAGPTEAQLEAERRKKLQGGATTFDPGFV